MEHIDWSAYFPVSTPHRISRRTFTSHRLLKLLHLWTRRVMKEKSKLVGYYPWDVLTKKRVVSIEWKEKLHFHQHTFDIQEQCKMLRSDVWATCVEQTALQPWVDYTKIGKQVLFTADQARKLVDVLWCVRFWNNLYTPRLITEADIVEISSLYTNQESNNDDMVFGTHRKWVAELCDFQFDVTYLTSTGWLLLSLIEKKLPVYMGVMNWLVDNKKMWLVRLCFDPIESK